MASGLRLSKAGRLVFASDYNFGKTPLWPDSLRTKILQPTARRVGIKKQISWHTFRRTYSSLLAATGDDVKVVQELMRHAKISVTPSSRISLKRSNILPISSDALSRTSSSSKCRSKPALFQIFLE